MRRLSEFTRSIYQDISVSPKEFALYVGVGMIAAVPVMAIITLVAVSLCWATGQPLWPIADGAYSASIGLLMLCGVILGFVSYLRRKWRESDER